MNNLFKQIWRPINITYSILCIALVLMFFTNRWEAGFYNFLKDVGFDDFITGLNLHKLCFFVIDICLWAIAFTPGKDEDERVEKIRNHVFKGTLTMSLLIAVLAGLVIGDKINFFGYTAFVLVFYMLMFRLLLYRDPAFLYMNQEQLKVHNKKVMRWGEIYMLIELSVVNAVAYNICFRYHQTDLFWMIVLANGFILGFIKIVYFTVIG